MCLAGLTGKCADIWLGIWLVEGMAALHGEQRTVIYDKDLDLEAYWYSSIVKKFPNHFHDYYVIAYVEHGRRSLVCRDREYIVDSGDVFLLNPFDNHVCCQVDSSYSQWSSLNIRKDTMSSVMQEITGTASLPEFTTVVLYRSETAQRLKKLLDLILNEQKDFEKEELFYILIDELITNYTTPVERTLHETSTEIRVACHYMDQNYGVSVRLDDLMAVTGIRKYTLIRRFLQQKGITPYHYLVTVRVNQARKLLEKGNRPIDAAMECGFVDQSHFTRIFKNFLGVTPCQYIDMLRK